MPWGRQELYKGQVTEGGFMCNCELGYSRLKSAAEAQNPLKRVKA